MERLKAFGFGLFCLFAAGAALFLSLTSFVLLLSTGELPLFPVRTRSVRWPEETAAAFTLPYFGSLVFYALSLCIGSALLLLASDQLLGTTVAEQVGRSRLRRAVAIALAVFFVLAIAASLVRRI